MQVCLTGRLLQAGTNSMLIFFKDHILIINIIKTSVSYLFRTIKADIEFYHCKLIFLNYEYHLLRPISGKNTNYRAWNLSRLS